MPSTLSCTAKQTAPCIHFHRLRWGKPFRSVRKARNVVHDRSTRVTKQQLARVAVATSRKTQVPRQNGTHKVDTPMPPVSNHLGNLGKRVVVVGGGWAGEFSRTLFSCATDTSMRACMLFWLTCKLVATSTHVTCVQALAQQSI